jgi:hypothetical protein
LRIVFDSMLAIGRGRGQGVGGFGGSRGSIGDGAVLVNRIVVATTYIRLFEGIQLTDDQAASARELIGSTQHEMLSQAPVPAPPALRMNPRTGVVTMEAASAEALMALVASDADRATLRARLLIPIR